MKTIRKYFPEWWIGKQAECENCHSIFELEAKDSVKEFRRPMVQIYFDCPACAEEKVKTEIRLFFK